jgi:outer membrane protein assembly factor BamB
MYLVSGLLKTGLICVAGWVLQAVAAFGAEGVLEDLPGHAGVSAGLCVYLDCGDGRAMADLARGGKFLVHGLALDAGAVPAVRQYLAAQGVAELTAVEMLSPAALPYEKNHVNLIVAENLPALLGKGLKPAEIVRVLAPYGGVCLGVPKDQEAPMKKQFEACGITEIRFVAGSRNWMVFNKPRPKEMDDWTHRFHGADANLVSRDTYFGWPNQLQWITGPAFPPGGDAGPLAQPQGSDNYPTLTLSAGGRVYYHYKVDNKIVARDAFSGALLWIKAGFLRQPTLNIIPAGDSVFVISSNSQLVALSAATGEVVRSFDKAAASADLKYENGVLYLFENSRIAAFDAATGQKKWSVPLSGGNAYMKPSGSEALRTRGTGAGNKVVEGGRIYIRNAAQELVALDAATGKLIFRIDLKSALNTAPIKSVRGGDWMFRFAADGKVFIHTISPSPNPKTFSGDAGRVGGGPFTATSEMANFHAISGKDGSVLWTQSVEMPYMRGGYYGYTYKAAGLFWLTRWPDNVWDLTKGSWNAKLDPHLEMRPEPPVYMGFDPDTGELRDTYTAPPGRNNKCQREAVTERFLIPGSFPYYFVDWKTKKIAKRSDSIWMMCEQVGPVIAQGLLFTYNGRTGCNCGKFQTYGNQAWSCDERTSAGEPEREEHPTEKGGAPQPDAPAEKAGDWPMYRHDMQRTAATAVSVPDELGILWRTAALLPPSPVLAKSQFLADQLLNVAAHDSLTGPTVSSGKVFVSLAQAGQVVALDEKTGKTLWTFHAAARVDAPPTMYKGLCLFGCSDGWVYCLRADDGRLLWRTRVAPAERRMIAYGQIESVWPVVGGVVVAGDTAYALAGRTTEADGGLYVLAMNPATGAPVWPAATRFYQHNPGDLRELPTMKDKSWNQWTATYDPRANIKANYVGTADLLGSDGELLQIGCRGFGNIACKTGTVSEKNCMTSPFGRQIHLGYVAQSSLAPYVPAAFQLGKDKSSSVRYARGMTINKKTRATVYDVRKDGGWKVETPGICQAICLAGDRILVGLSDKALENPKGELWMLSTDGKKLAAIPLPAAPAYDGIAVANGRVYVTLTDTTVICLEKK